jgi:outer membrane protein assembly factor BamD (BamD/ComL family)
MTTKLQLLIGIMLWIGTALPALATGEFLLQNLTKIDEFDQSRVVFDFSELPEFQLETSGQRVDLLLKKTSVSPSLRMLPEDDKIVKILLAGKPDALLVSILLHKIPARVAAIKSPAANQVTLDIRWAESGGKRPAIAFQLSGMPAAHKTLDGISTPQQSSPYAGRWPDFFRTFQTPVDIGVPLQHAFPALPHLSAGAEDTSLKELVQLANKGDWRSLAGRLKQRPDSGGGTLWTVLKAETLLRTGHPHRALELLESRRPEITGRDKLSYRSVYLYAMAQAVCDLPYQARVCLAPALAEKEAVSDIVPYMRLLEAELLLAIKKPSAAYEILKEAVQFWPTPLQRPVQWRRAEALTDMQRADEARTLFGRLFTRPDAYANLPDIQYHAGLAYLATGHYRQAGKHFENLDSRLSDTIDRGKAAFLKARAAYLTKDFKTALVTLEQLRDNFEGSGPGFRAWLALLDHRMLNPGRTDFLQIARDYGTIAKQAPDRSLREEAALKQALVHHLHHRPEQAADLLQGFLRNFSGGPLHREAKALLAEILPPLIRDLIAKGQDRKAVILVEQNRDLLINGNLSWPFLPDLAEAYIRLGLWEKACKSYYFMIDRGAERSGDEPYYLPLVQLLFDRGQYAVAASMAGRYLEKFPRGKNRNDLYELQLKALARSNRLDEAAALLEKPGQPGGEGVALQSARIHWSRDKTREIIEQPRDLEQSPEGQLLRAEALFKASRHSEAYNLYEKLLQQKDFYEQALYRCAQIKLLAGDSGTALKLFTQLTENNNTSFWARLAKDAIAAQRKNRVL